MGQEQKLCFKARQN